MNEIIQTSGFSIESLLRGILGITTLLLIAFAFSKNRKGIDWKLVAKGLLIQIAFAVLILKVPFVQSGFEWLSSIFVTILGFTREGSLFLFGDIVGNINSFGFIFAFQVSALRVPSAETRLTVCRCYLLFFIVPWLTGPQGRQNGRFTIIP